jgi:hypothetical protein
VAFGEPEALGVFIDDEGVAVAIFAAEEEDGVMGEAAMWYQLQGSIGVYRVEIAGGTYLELADRYWVPWVRSVLRRYRRVVVG